MAVHRINSWPVYCNASTSYARGTQRRFPDVHLLASLRTLLHAVPPGVSMAYDTTYAGPEHNEVHPSGLDPRSLPISRMICTPFTLAPAWRCQSG
jgi:hypothetical protein